LCADRGEKSFVPEAIIPEEKGMIVMEEVLHKNAHNEVLTVENLNRMNDVFAKYIFANEARKKLTLGLINSFFELEGTAEIWKSILWNCRSGSAKRAPS